MPVFTSHTNALPPAGKLVSPQLGKAAVVAAYPVLLVYASVTSHTGVLPLAGKLVSPQLGKAAVAAAYPMLLVYASVY